MKIVTSGVGTPTTAFVANTPNGEVLLQLDATSGSETAAITWGDQLNFWKADVATPILGDGPFAEFRIKIGAVTAVGANDTVVFGMATAFNATLSSIAEYAWFKLTGNMNLLLETNDGTTANTAFNPLFAPVTLVAGKYYYFTIDFSDPTNIAFWVSNFDSSVASNSEVFDIFLGTVSMKALTTAMLFQPIVVVQRSSGTDNVDVTVDLISTKWARL
jgi:hypothetical protein